MSKAQSFLGYCLGFVAGILCAGAFLGTIIKDNERYRNFEIKQHALTTGMTALTYAQILSRLRLGETQDLIAWLEQQVDAKTITASRMAQLATAKQAREAWFDDMQQHYLGAIKAYRRLYPAPGDLKPQVDEILNQASEISFRSPKKEEFFNSTALARLCKSKNMP